MSAKSGNYELLWKGKAMDSDRTELEWEYQPTDFFEAPFRLRVNDYNLIIDNGRAVAKLYVASDPVPDATEEQIEREVRAFFSIRQLQTHRSFQLNEPKIIQYAGQARRVLVRFTSKVTAVCRAEADIIVRDNSGKVIHDSKAERIANDNNMLASVAPKIACSQVLHAIIDSYGAAVADPENELVHLYEVRDSLAKHYGKEDKVRETLLISKPEWQKIGRLANDEPLIQGRHRGKYHSALRVATAQELEETRTIVRRWIVAFADTLP